MTNHVGDPILGNRITQYRKERGLTLSALAQRCGIGVSMLSQIEKGNANPSLNSLKLISKALDISLFNLFLEDEKKETMVVKPESRKKVTSPEFGDISYELLTPDLKGDIEFVLMKIDPKKESSKELLSHQGEETAYISKGKIDLYINSNTDPLMLSEGDSIRIPAQVKHRWKNSYPEKAEIIFALTPPNF